MSGQKSIFRELADFASSVCNGKIPQEMGDWLAAAPVTQLRKDNGKARPIAVGDTIRRICAKLLAKEAASKAEEIFNSGAG